MKTFFNLPVQVYEHKTLNSSKGIVRIKNLKCETEENILEYLESQGVTNVKRFKIKKNIQVGKDQEKAQSEKDSHSKNRGGKKPN